MGPQLSSSSSSSVSDYYSSTSGAREAASKKDNPDSTLTPYAALGLSSFPCWKAMPEELLIWIFKHVQSEQHNRPKAYYQSLFSMRTVCKRWEDAITASAMLWTLIDMTKPSAVTMILECSAACPLRLVCCDLLQSAPEIEASVEKLRHCMDRVTELEAIVDGAQMTAILPLLQWKAPKMEVASISFLKKLTEPIQLFGGVASGVSSILLSGIQIDWTTLTSNHLKRITFSGLIAPLDVILEILEGCSSQVEAVALDSIDFRESYGAGLPAKQATTFPNLVSLYFAHVEPFAIEYLLASISVPSCLDCRIVGTPFAGRSLEGTFNRFVEKVSLRDSLEASSTNNGVEFDASGALFYLDSRRILFSFHLDCDRLGSPPTAVWEEMYRAFARPWRERGSFKPTFKSLPMPYNIA
ncbi:hypothetical protein M407DRAFT_27101 [Tulasnella calospora MUT 4182]|uniref:Uncharacterized protein n=1 Tax=Tulasnella calospora MUT 4182 TaxID=1051891 RepID=A0A0C3QD24_9AGAM|nr:hypothetical protein M407DRAFT_27101 [Tulasnella calospora MUT 4182]